MSQFVGQASTKYLQVNLFWPSSKRSAIYLQNGRRLWDHTFIFLKEKVKRLHSIKNIFLKRKYKLIPAMYMSFPQPHYYQLQNSLMKITCIKMPLLHKNLFKQIFSCEVSNWIPNIKGCNGHSIFLYLWDNLKLYLNTKVTKILAITSTSEIKAA